MKYRITVLALGAALLGLTGCHPLQALKRVGGSCHDPQPYLRAQSVAPLKIPAGLDTPDTSTSLHIPPLTTPAPPARGQKEPCLDQPPPCKAPRQAPPQA